MIIVKQSRSKDGEVSTLPSFEEGPTAALSRLLEVDLAWGGHILHVTPTSIIVRSFCCDCIDNTVYEGAQEEMAMLVDTAYWFLRAEGECQAEIEEAAAQAAVRHSGGNTAVLTMLAPHLLGRHRLRVAVMLAAGIEAMDDIRAGINARLRDIIAAISLMKETGSPFRETIGLAQ